MNRCRLCRKAIICEWLDFGMQPITNRFLRSAAEREYTHSLAIGCCPACGTVQLQHPMPANEVRPRFDWINYNEPESHLDQLADDIRKLPGLTPDSVLCGMSYKDESLLRRLRERGLPRTWVADMGQDLGIDKPGAGIESIQQSMTITTIAGMVKRHGQPNVVILRHVVEHSHDLHGVLEALRCLIAPGGYLVFEVPDAQRALEKRDYSTVWEEHIFYFTPPTLRNCFALAGFELAYFKSFPYTLEDSLVVIVKSSAGSQPASLGRNELGQETRRAENFIRSFPAQRESYRRYFEHYRREHGKIAFLGAGHLSCAMINYFGLGQLVEFVVDDNPHKKGLFMPGSHLPIRGSDALLQSGVKLCCMTVRPEIEARVVEKNQPFLARGGCISSIFPDSPYALAV